MKHHVWRALLQSVLPIFSLNKGIRTISRSGDSVRNIIIHAHQLLYIQRYL
ncbi:hypothetical protein Y11_14131 [Yersinia enterocolitica subsp. palearctica Y11]|uniref:Uncharacterized protein n=1 Tax=Yersinia enterocolitica subsp. palearctica serotype O:3 (strain DSM 13030 / CIP 106945 / Y11) TaxID=930944 RepID=A0A0H3NNV4_YERE1|nr:hypothetical protein Y11_14131 [Yersinia enterocolitica subsp. palearctica Y11]CCO67706.1 hypothetical protein D322_810 [Yersinia enterocolitica IP 10393]